MRRLALLLLVSCCGLLVAVGTAAAAPAPGDLDLGFGERGYSVGDSFTSGATATMAAGPEGDVFVASPRILGCEIHLPCAVELSVSHFSKDGARDPGFGSESSVEVRASQLAQPSIAVGADGRPVVAIDYKRCPILCQFSAEGGFVLARFDRDGGLDPSFGAGGIVERPDSSAGHLTVSSDGGVFVASGGETPSGESGALVSRYTSSGVLDAAYGTAGTASVALPGVSTIMGLASAGGGLELGISQDCCDIDGSILHGSTFLRFQPGGGLDTSLAGSGQYFLPRGQSVRLRSIAAGPGGKLYAAIEEREGRGSVVVRLGADGYLDPSFGKGGEVPLGPTLGVSEVKAIAVDDGGRLVGVAGGGDEVSAFRLRSRGNPDPTFAGGRRVPIEIAGESISAVGLALQPGGRIVLLGEVGGYGRTSLLVGLTGGESAARCQGKRATMVGTRRADSIVGTSGRDVIAGLGGRDQVRGLGGDDLICGGPGRDRLFGGRGEDRVRQ